MSMLVPVNWDFKQDFDKLKKASKHTHTCIHQSSTHTTSPDRTYRQTYIQIDKQTDIQTDPHTHTYRQTETL